MGRGQVWGCQGYELVSLVLAVLKVSVKDRTHRDTKAASQWAERGQVRGCQGFEVVSLVFAVLKVSVKNGTHGDTKNACSRVSSHGLSWF